MQLSGIRAISFDLDDTLWPFRPAIERAEATLLSWLRTHAPLTRELLAAPDALRTYRAQAVADHPDLHHDLSGLRRVSIRAILVAAGEDPALAEPAFDVFFEERLRVDLYPEVLPALTWLSERYPLVALTNGNGCVHKAGVASFFKSSLSAATLGVAKPHASAFHAAAQAVGVTPAELLHVGDDWALDVVGAMEAGVPAAWLRRGEGGHADHADPAAVAAADPLRHTVVSDLDHLCVELGRR